MKSVILVTIFSLVSGGFSYKFPDNFKRCTKDESDVDSCFKTTIENALKLIGSKGIPSLNLPPIEPVEATKLEIGAGNNAVNLVQKYSDVKLVGLSTFTMEDAHYDAETKTLKFTMRVPRIDQKAKYELNGKVLLLPVFGNGDAVLTFYDNTLIHTITFEEETKNNKPHFNIKSYKLSFLPSKAHYQFDNLFNGDEKLASNILTVINENWKELYEDVRGGVQGAYAEIFKKIGNRLFNSVPISEIFFIEK